MLASGLAILSESKRGDVSLVSGVIGSRSESARPVASLYASCKSRKVLIPF